MQLTFTKAVPKRRQRYEFQFRWRMCVNRIFRRREVLTKKSAGTAIQFWTFFDRRVLLGEPLITHYQVHHSQFHNLVFCTNSNVCDFHVTRIFRNYFTTREGKAVHDSPEIMKTLEATYFMYVISHFLPRLLWLYHTTLHTYLPADWYSCIT